MPPENETTPRFGSGRSCSAAWSRSKSPSASRLSRLREDDAEAAAADAARQVTRAGDVVQDRAMRREHVVRGEVADPRVDRREPIDVEHEQGHLLAPASSTSDLEVEERVEGRSVVELRQRVALRHGIGLPELERGLERRSADAEDVLERRDVDLAEPAVGRSRQHGEHARIGRRVHERHREAAADRVVAPDGASSPLNET